MYTITMDYIEFGKNKTKVSKLILGLMRTSDLSTDQIATLANTALDQGINYFDTADCYDNGKAESQLGLTFEQNPGLRNKVFLQSKCGIRNENGLTWYDFSEEYILQAVDASLSRLKTDHLDSLLLHRPDALMEPEEIASAFEKLKKSGKVLNFGLSNCNPMTMELIRRFINEPICANQVQFSVAHTPMIDSSLQVNMKWDGATMRDGGILEYCKMNNIAVQAWSTMQYGYFEGIYINSEKYPHLNQVLYRIAGEHNVNVSAVALAWILRHPANMQAVIGTTNPNRIQESARYTDFTLSKKEWYELYQASGNRLP